MRQFSKQNFITASGKAFWFPVLCLVALVLAGRASALCDMPRTQDSSVPSCCLQKVVCACPSPAENKQPVSTRSQTVSATVVFASLSAGMPCPCHFSPLTAPQEVPDRAAVPEMPVLTRTERFCSPIPPTHCVVFVPENRLSIRPPPLTEQPARAPPALD